MKELITIKNNNGKDIVSAKELYVGLGLNESNWSRWYPTNIENNEFFIEGKDWIGIRPNDENTLGGRPTLDFAITLDFAKHLAMMAKTEKSHEYRNYFLECEKKVNQVPQLSKELQAIFMLDNKTQVIEDRVDNHDNRLDKIENRMTIDFSQQEEIRTKVNAKVIQELGGMDAPAYKELNKKAFASFWRDYKRQLNVNSYRNTATAKFGQALKFINNWEPNRELDLMIKGANSQRIA